MTPLHEAIAEIDIERVRQLLAEGADVNARDEVGATPLHYAGGEHATEIVRLLLEAGADLSLVDRQGQTAYDWAISTCRGDSMPPILLWSGLGSCPLDAADQAGTGRPDVTPDPSPLERAIKEDDLDALARLLELTEKTEGSDDFWNAPIVIAVNANRPKAIEFLVKRGADPNLTDWDGETLLHLAAQAYDLETVRTLIRLGAQVNVTGGADQVMTPLQLAWSRSGASSSPALRADQVMTPLQLACRRGDAAIVRLLLEHGADPNLTEHVDGWTALRFAVFDSQPEIIRILLEYGADVLIHDGWHTPLDSAVHDGKREEAKALYWAIEEKRPEAYGTPLHGAANKGDAAAIEALLKSGARIDAGDYLQKTPLHWAVGQRRPLLAELILEFHGVESASDAAQLSQEEAINVLIDHGADLEARDVYGRTPLIEAVVRGQEAAARVLVEAGADVSAQDVTGWPPLLYAAAGGGVDMLRLLISKGADLQVVRNGRNALTYASHHGHLAAAQLFIAEGVPINPPGWTPLHSAAYMGHKEIIALLLANGADRNAKNEQGRTACDEAKEQKRMAIVKMLRETR